MERIIPILMNDVLLKEINERIVEFELDRYEIKNAVGVDSGILLDMQKVSGKPIVVIKNLESNEFAVIGSIMIQGRPHIVVHHNGACYFVGSGYDIPIIHEDLKESRGRELDGFIDSMDREITIDEYITGFINIL